MAAKVCEYGVPVKAEGKVEGVAIAKRSSCPEGIRTRMRLLTESAMYTLPGASTATPEGSFNSALVAGKLSPMLPCVPFPATVVITPFETSRMR